MRKRWIVLVILVGLVACLCLSSGLVWWGGRLKHTPGTGPSVRIIDPHYGDRVPMERAVLVQSEARDATNLVTQVELWVDGQLQGVESSQEPQGTSHLYAAQGWQPSSPGSHTLMLRALNSRGAAGQAIIVVDAVEGLFGFSPQGEHIYVGDLTSVAYVASGVETIEDIAESRELGGEDILELNPGLDADQVLEEGQVVVLPFHPDTAAEGEEEEEEEPTVGPQVGGREGPPAPPVVVPEPPEQLPSEGARVNLMITNLTLSNLNPQPGEEIVVGVTIMNVGGTPAENFSWAWDPGTGEGWIQDGSPVASLVPGDDAIREMTYTYRWAGDFSGQARADSLDAYDEPDETDNFAYATVTVGQERPFVPLDPIPPGLRGDLLRLLRRLRDGHRMETYDPGDGTPTLDAPPAPPTLEVSHEGCDITVEWCPNSISEEGFYLYRGDTTTGGDFQQIAEFVNPPHDSCSLYTDDVPYAGEYYYYMVASNEFGEGTSDVVREQVTVSDCPALATLVGSNLMVLEVEVLEAEVVGYYDKVYCYASLDDLPEERFPPGQDEFFELEGQHFNLEEYLGGENSRIVTVPADQELRVFAECWGWVEGAAEPVPLGEFANWHGSEQWDGQILLGQGGGFSVQYRINKVTGPGMISQDYPDISCAKPPPTPWALHVGESNGQVTLEWAWSGNMDVIEGVWILCDGEKSQWVDKRFVGAGFGAGSYWAELDDFLAYPECESGCDLSVVAGLKDEPGASNPCFNSAPSDPLAHPGPSCSSEIRVRFDAVWFGCIEDCTFGGCCSSDLTYGWIVINARDVLFIGTPVAWSLSSEAVSVSMTGESGGISPDSGESVALSQVLDDYNLRYGAISGMDVHLAPDEPLILQFQFWDHDFALGNDPDLLCEGMGGVGPYTSEEWNSMQNYSSSHSQGSGEYDSCLFYYTINPTVDYVNPSVP